MNVQQHQNPYQVMTKFWVSEVIHAEGTKLTREFSLRLGSGVWTRSQCQRGCRFFLCRVRATYGALKKMQTPQLCPQS